MRGFNHRPLTVLIPIGALALAACSASQTPAGPGLPPASSATAITSDAHRSVTPLRAKFDEFTNGISAYAAPHGIINSPTDIWFTEPGVNQIAKISSSGLVKEFPVGTAANNIAYGADGNLWYTESGDAIGRMTPKGKVTNFQVGSAAYGPWDIALGSDGNMWFTDRTPNGSSFVDAIGRITPSGSVTLFPINASEGDVAVHDITLGPDGNVWFTEEFANRIGKITPSGSITEFSSGITQNSTVVDVTGGPDGNVWFTEYSTGFVARITPSGTVTEFALPSGSNPGSIATMGDYVWVCEQNADQLSRVDMSGNVTSYTLPGSCFQDAALKNHLWITDPAGNGMIRGSGLL